MHAGRKLKVLRNARGLTGRQVELASRRIAAAREDKRFCISNGWLAQLENGDSEPSICKIFSLCAIYKMTPADLLRLYGVDIDEVERYQSIADPDSTQLVNLEDAEGLRSSLRNRPTTLLPGSVRPLTTSTPPRYARNAQICSGYIGLNDKTMYPMIRPGALVRIDLTQNRIQTGAPNAFERPIYFVELRNSYACGWCELQGTDLLIVPHHSSPARIRRFTYLKEAEIVGRVISFDTRCVDELDLNAGIDQQARVRVTKVG